MNHRPIIGVITGHAGEYYTKQILQGIGEAGLELGYDVVFFSNIYNEEKITSETACEKRIYELAVSEELSGLILIPESIVDGQVREEILKRIRNVSCPIVIVGEESPEFLNAGFPVVQSEDSSDMEALTDHLLDEHTFRRVDLLTGPTEIKISNDRTAGFLASVRKHGLPMEACRIHTGNFWYNSGEDLADAYAEGIFPLPDAVVCQNDLMAYGLMKKLAVHGIQIPQQVAVAAYEYSDRRVLHRPVLTCMERNRHNIGKHGMQLLHSLIEHMEAPSAPPFDGKMIFGESCGCSADGNRLLAEYADAAHTREMYDWNPLASLERKLIGCRELKSFLGTLGDYHWLISGVENIYLRLFSEWYDTETAETEQMFCHSILHWKGAASFETTQNCLSDITSRSPVPSVWYFTPLFIGERLFGQCILQYRTPESYDSMFRNWLKSVSTCLEHLRMKNDIRYLLRVQSLSDDHETSTGLFNYKGIKRAFTQMKQESSQNLHCLMIQTCLHHSIIFDEGKSQKTAAIFAAAEAVKEFCKAGGIAAHLGNGRFLCFIRHTAHTEILEKTLLAIFMQQKRYLKEYGTDSFAFSLFSCEDRSFDQIFEKAETELESRTTEYRKRRQNAHYISMLKLRNYIYMNPSMTFSSDTICQECGLRLSSVRASYKNCFSISFHQDCINARVAHALYLLLTTQASGIEVATECGYQDSKYFLRQFSASIGMTVTQFHALHLRSE